MESWRAVEGRREAFASLNAPGSAFHRPWKTAVDSRGPSETLTRRGFPQLPTALSSSLPVGAVMPLSGGLA